MRIGLGSERERPWRGLLTGSAFVPPRSFEMAVLRGREPEADLIGDLIPARLLRAKSETFSGDTVNNEFSLRTSSSAIICPSTLEARDAGAMAEECAPKVVAPTVVLCCAARSCSARCCRTAVGC